MPDPSPYPFQSPDWESLPPQFRPRRLVRRYKLGEPIEPQPRHAPRLSDDGEIVLGDGSTYRQNPGQVRLRDMLRSARERYARAKAQRMTEALRRARVAPRARQRRHDRRPAVQRRGEHARATAHRGPPAADDDPPLPAPTFAHLRALGLSWQHLDSGGALGAYVERLAWTALAEAARQDWEAAR